MKKKYLITGCSGFIGFHLTLRMLKDGYIVVGIDNMNNYYDLKLKNDRLKILLSYKNFFFKKFDIQNHRLLFNLFKKYKFDIVINLAAQAGVRNSISDPDTYFNYNVNGFYNILKVCHHFKIKHLVYASSSSVYGSSTKYPFKENIDTSSPKSFYAATKKINEVMAHSFSEIYNMKVSGLRFFTVYGPFGRPDMSLYKFLDAIFNKKTIYLFNKGNHYRDFTFIDDCIDGILKILKRPLNKSNHEVFNIGNGRSRPLIKFLNEILRYCDVKNVKIKKISMQKGDVYKTHSSIKKINKISPFKPKVSIEKGIKIFIDWYKNYHSIN